MSDRRNNVEPVGLTPWGRERAESWALRREAWQVFFTLTFADRPAPGITFKGCVPKKAVLDCTPAFNWLRRSARVMSLRWTEMLWALRLEPGELGGRYHYHGLIGGIDPAKAHARTCGVLETLWRHSLGYGIAEVRLWDGRDAVGYLLKTDGEWSEAAANGYELRKFNSAERVILGQAFVENWSVLKSISYTSRETATTEAAN